ncbi:MAG: hypothetical protein AAF355_04220 [Myxococcota bacterium]
MTHAERHSALQLWPLLGRPTHYALFAAAVCAFSFSSGCADDSDARGLSVFELRLELPSTPERRYAHVQVEGRFRDPRGSWDDVEVYTYDLQSVPVDASDPDHGCNVTISISTENPDSILFAPPIAGGFVRENNFGMQVRTRFCQRTNPGRCSDTAPTWLFDFANPFVPEQATLFRAGLGGSACLGGGWNDETYRLRSDLSPDPSTDAEDPSSELFEPLRNLIQQDPDPVLEVNYYRQWNAEDFVLIGDCARGEDLRDCTP